MKQSICLMSLFLLCGCTFIPDYQRPSMDIPGQWNNQAIGYSSDIAQDWWMSFGSVELNQLMDEALSHNHDVLAGIQRVKQARANLKIARADFFPNINASADASRVHSHPAKASAIDSTNLQAGLSIAYELDLFGANRSNVAAAGASLHASQYDEDALALVVMSDVAQTYFLLLNLQERLAIANTNLNNAKEVLRIISARVREGAESDLELAQQSVLVANNEAARALLIEQLQNSQNALAVLLGKTPQALNIKEYSLAVLTVPVIFSKQPSELLERRPDIKAAEASLVAANANIGVARAAFFPSISLGLANNISAAGFHEPVTRSLSLTSSLGMPLFQGGRIKGGVELATARQRELVEIYRKTVLTAFQEVEDALVAVKTAQDREDVLEIAMQQARKAYQLSKRKYDLGAIDFQTLLDTQNAQLSAEDSFAQAKLSRLTTAVSLFKALGGGWKES